MEICDFFLLSFATVVEPENKLHQVYRTEKERTRS